MNILVTGANGQLGHCVRRHADTTAHKYIFTDVEELDITNLDAIRALVTEENVQAIINCAAYTNVDKAESDVDFCRLLNATAPGYLARAMAEAGGLLIHISTDYVFGAEPYNTPCREEQTGTPTGVYGATKLEGEKNILASGCKHMIFRTAWLYSEFGHNFVKTMLRLTAEKPQLKVVFDQCGTPTYADDLAKAIVEIVENEELRKKNGIYHYSNEGVTSWFDFTKAIAEMSGQTACDIQPCHSDEFPSPVTRPAYSVLDKTKFKETFGMKVPYWRESLKICIKNLTEKI